MTMRQSTITVVKPTKALTMNDRMGWHERAGITKTWRDAAFWWAKQHRLSCRRAVGQVEIWVEFGTTQPYKRRDPHNWYPTIKAICDGFTQAGVWADDDHEHVRTYEPTFTNRVDHASMRITLNWDDGE